MKSLSSSLQCFKSFDFFKNLIFNFIPFPTEDGPVTSSTDIWAYGLVIWEMIALVPPHVNDLEDESVGKEDMMDSTLDDSNYNMDESVTFLKEIMPLTNNKYGKRF